jgi:hypothetical protein
MYTLHSNFRCIYQLRIWLCSHIPIMPQIDPTNFGWIKNKGILEPVLATMDPIPNDIRKLMNIFCTDQLCQNNKCVCMKEGLKCCNDCSCKKCLNNVSYLYEDEDDEKESI